MGLLILVPFPRGSSCRPKRRESFVSSFNGSDFSNFSFRVQCHSWNSRTDLIPPPGASLPLPALGLEQVDYLTHSSYKWLKKKGLQQGTTRKSKDGSKGTRAICPRLPLSFSWLQGTPLASDPNSHDVSLRSFSLPDYWLNCIPHESLPFHYTFSPFKDWFSLPRYKRKEGFSPSLVLNQQ